MHLEGCRTCWHHTKMTPINQSLVHVAIQDDDAIRALQTDRLAKLLHDKLMPSPELVCMHKKHSSSNCLHWNVRLPSLSSLEADELHC